MKALGALVWNGESEGPVGQLGYAHAVLLDDEEMLRPEWKSVDRVEDGEGQPMEIGDDEADELGEEPKSILNLFSRRKKVMCK
jgi:hypothetical protein